MTTMNHEMFYTYKAKVTNVSDGDTFTALVDMGFETYRTQKFRLADIDTPEIFSSTASAAEKLHGREARDRVVQLILNKEVWVESIKDRTEKYGRFLARVFIPEQNVYLSDVLKAEGFEKKTTY